MGAHSKVKPKPKPDLREKGWPFSFISFSFRCFLLFYAFSRVLRAYFWHLPPSCHLFRLTARECRPRQIHIKSTKRSFPWFQIWCIDILYKLTPNPDIIRLKYGNGHIWGIVVKLLSPSCKNAKIHPITYYTLPRLMGLTFILAFWTFVSAP